VTQLGPSFPFRCDRCGHEIEGGNLQGTPCHMCGFFRRWWQCRGRYKQIPWDDAGMHERVIREIRWIGRALPPRPRNYEELLRKERS